MFPNKFRNIFVVETMFSSLTAHMFSNVSSTKNIVSRLDMFKQCFKTIVQT